PNDPGFYPGNQPLWALFWPWHILADDCKAMKTVQTWEVVGGNLSGGLLVRSEKALGSQREQQRLRTGSVVEEVELDGERLHYRLLEGSGPPKGWVSTKLEGRELLQRCSSTKSARNQEKEETLRKAAALQVAQMDILAVALNVAATVQTGPRFKVTQVTGSLLEITPCEESVSLEDFWPPECTLDAQQKHYVYWAIVCSSSCDTWTMALALTLKELSDYGVILTHESRAVTNLIVLNTPTMDVSDLLPGAFELLEPESGARVSMFSTPASQLSLKQLGAEVQERLGWGVSPTFNEELRDSFVDRFGEQCLTNSVPHWWIAAIVQGAYGHYMVHIDLCGPAYGTFCRSRSKALRHGKELPLDYFITPCYLMTPYHAQQTFVLHPDYLNFEPSDAKFTSLPEIRHLRCFYQSHLGYITATPLPCFVDSKANSWLRLRSPSEEAVDTVQSWKDGLQSIASYFRGEIFKALEPGTYVEVDSTCDNATFAGRLGKVLHAAKGELELLVQLHGLAEPAKLPPDALKFYPRYVQYLTLAEMGELVALQLALLEPLTPMPSELIGYLRRER
ncbi:unnamed protein product, partial [Effrenium voratum]